MQETTAQLKPENLVTAWEAMTKMVVETARAMPEEYYTYKPTEELRDFADQIAHTSGANYLFGSVVKKAAPDHYGSDCPMAGHQIESLLDHGSPPEHPLSLLRLAYGI